MSWVDGNGLVLVEKNVWFDRNKLDLEQGQVALSRSKWAWLIKMGWVVFGEVFGSSWVGEKCSGWDRLKEGRRTKYEINYTI